MDWLFIKRLELFSTINIIHSPVINNKWSLTLLFGLMFVAAVCLMVYFNKRLLKRQHFIIILILVFWSPLLAHALYNNLADWFNNLGAMSYSLEDKRLLKMCEISYNHQAPAGCGLPIFLNDLVGLVAPGSKFKLISNSPSAPFINNFLVGKYQLVDNLQQADYLLVFETNQNYALDSRQHLLLINGDQVDDFGKYELVLKRHNSGWLLKNDN